MLFDIIMGMVEYMLVVGILLVLVVLFVFLGNFCVVVVVVVVILLVLCVLFISMEYFYVLVNLILFGVIDFGVIIDVVVIVMENIMWYLEEGVEKLDDVIVKVISEV